MASIEFDGFDEIEKHLSDMILKESDKKKAMRTAITPVAEEVKENAPTKTRRLQKSVKIQVKREELAIVGIVKMGQWYSAFQEFGTSQQKANVGFFERSVNKTTNKVVATLANELLDKAR